MMTINFGDYEYTNYDPDGLFETIFLPEWLEDPFVKEMVLDIDKSEVISPFCINSPVLGQIAPTYLSGGVKSIIMMLKQKEYIMDLCNCGTNCEKWIARLSKEVDFEVTCCTLELTFKGLELDALCKNDNSYILRGEDYIRKAIKYV